MPTQEHTPPASAAVLRFRHNAAGSDVSRQGHISPGGRLIVEYDPARLPPSPTTPAEGEIFGHVRFWPRGQTYSGKVSETRAPGQGGVPRDVPLEVLVPSDATNVELWFERRAADITTGWDSRYGQNYWFAVVASGLPVPEPSVPQRPDAVVDPAKIRVLEDAAVKEQTRMGPAGRRVHTGLVIHALIAETTLPTDVWADIRVFDAADELVHAGDVTLLQQESTSTGAEFGWHDEIYQGSGGGSGMGVWSRPNAHTIQYRLYCRVKSPNQQVQVFTDGVLHEFEVPSDEMI